MVCYKDLCSRLAGQVAPKLDAVLLIGGVPAGPQERALKVGVDIVTGTPGEGHWPLHCCAYLVKPAAEICADRPR